MRPSRLRIRLAMLILCILATGSATGSAQETPRHLYRTQMLRAAPGELASVIEMIKKRLPVWQETHEYGPFWMRHSQGDQWDLLLLFPLGESTVDFHGAITLGDRNGVAAKSATSEVDFRESLLKKVAWREDLYVSGPPPEVVAARFADARFFHVEIFLALADKRVELLEQRQMENTYLAAIDRPTNLIFDRVAGAAWDCYTIGFYRDIKHFAGSADIPGDVEEKAAVEAGFASASTIGTYLRELISQHHDTLAVAVR